MEGFKFSPDCVIAKLAKGIAQELLKGSFIVGCDYKNKQLILENVFHYTESEKRLEIYKMFSDKTNIRRKLKLDIAFVLLTSGNVISAMTNILQTGIEDYDLFVVDRYSNLYTTTVYDKYGKGMRLA